MGPYQLKLSLLRSRAGSLIIIKHFYFHCPCFHGCFHSQSLYSLLLFISSVFSCSCSFPVSDSLSLLLSLSSMLLLALSHSPFHSLFISVALSLFIAVARALSLCLSLPSSQHLLFHSLIHMWVTSVEIFPCVSSPQLVLFVTGEKSLSVCEGISLLPLALHYRAVCVHCVNHTHTHTHTHKVSPPSANRL